MKNNTAFSIRAYGTQSEVLGVYIKLRDSAKIARTKEISPTVFADYDNRGKVVGVEFTEPAGFNIQVMAKLSRKARIPELEAFDVSKMRRTEMALK